MVATVADLRSMEVIIPVDELDIIKVKEGQEASITAEALPGKQYRANVTRIALEGETSDSVTTYDVTLNIVEPGELKTGMTLNVELEIESKKDVLLLPIEAIQQQGRNRAVFIQDASQESGRKRTNVEIGLVTENYVEIINGLKEGEVVVYTPPSSSSQQQQRPTGGLIPGIPGGLNNTRQGGGGNARPGGNN